MDIKKPKSIDLGFSHEKLFLQSSSTNETKQKNPILPKLSYKYGKSLKASLTFKEIGLIF